MTRAQAPVSGVPTLVGAVVALAGAACWSPFPVSGQEQGPPPAAPLRAYAPPPVRATTLANGVRVVVVERPALPIVTARLIVDAGATLEPGEKAGLALLTAEMLREGSAARDGRELARRMEQLGATFDTRASYGEAVVQVTALTPAFPEAFALAAEALVSPVFPAPAFERVKRIALARREQTMAVAEGIAPEVFRRAVYAPASPFARPPGGTATTLAGIEREDVVGWHWRNYAPATTTVLLVGDITLAEAQRLVEGALGSWRTQGPTRAPVNRDTRSATEARVILVDRPGSAQSAVVLGEAGVGGEHPDVIPLTAVQHVLGGGFGSRVNLNLRERHGYTYGARTDFTTLRGTGWLAIVTSVRTDATAPALVEALAEYRRIVEAPIPADELAAHVENLVAGFPSSVQTVQGLAQRVQSLLRFDLPLDYFATYRERLGRITPEDAQRVARAHLHPDAPTLVVVGDLASIEAPIRALGLGTVEVWDREGDRLR